MRKKFARPSKKKCEIVNSEKIVRFQYKKKMYTYRYESGVSYGFGYILEGGKKIYGPLMHERTPEGVEVFEAFWNEHLKSQEGETSVMDPKLRKEVIVMGP